MVGQAEEWALTELATIAESPATMPPAALIRRIRTKHQNKGTPAEM